VAKPKDCLNCGDPVREGCSFCGPDCLEDHEARERQRRISGAR
jgi:predicted nucleic acid-binding Zn ribbon protein